MFSSRFIQATRDFATYEKPVCAPYLRKVFTLDRLPEKAALSLTSTGFYRLWVNGKELTASRLAPCITNPDNILFYDTYDVTPFLTTGQNCLALLLGNGFSNAIGGFIWEFDKAVFRSSPKLALSFEAACGEQSIRFEANESFKCAASPIFFDDLRSGEFYDANAEIPGWNMPDFDDSTWQNAYICEPPRGKAVQNDTEPVIITKELKPVKIYEGYHKAPERPGKKCPDAKKHSQTAFYKPEPGEKGFVFEFSENTACVPHLRIRGRKGQKIVLQAAEYGDKDGGINFESIGMFYPDGFCQRDIYICNGEGVEEYIPSFTYHGARYFLVIGADKEQISEDTVTMLVQNSDVRERGCFSCSDPIANALQKCARTSDLANLVHIPTDCPHREKNGWTGDAAVSAEHMIQNLSVERVWKHWLKMICAAQRADGVLPGIVPTAGYSYTWGNGPLWDSVIIELPYQAYIYRGDLSLFREVSDTVMRYLNYLAGKRNPDGSLAFGLGDWCHALRQGGGNYLCPLEVSDTIIAINICRKAALLFDKCGMGVQRVFAEALTKELLQTVRERFIDYDTMTMRGSCQTAQALGLYYNIFEKGERKEAYQRLLEFVHMEDDHLNGGMLGVRILFRTLASFGDAELAYTLITRTDAPSYGILVKNFGLVSLPETFRTCVNGYDTSLNHHFFGDISGFFIAHIAGLQINPYHDDPTEVRVAPSFIASLDHAEAYYDTVGGRIEVKWERAGDAIDIRIQKADGVHGLIELPHGYVFTHISGADDRITSDRRIYELQNAVYTVCKKK